MANEEMVLQQMLELSEQLTQEADRLKEMTAKSIAEEELERLQQSQQSLLTQIAALDASLKGKEQQETEKSKQLRKSIHEKLKSFEKSNAEFFAQLQKRLSFIHFGEKP